MIYFSSDHHFYHQNIIRFCNRPFATVEEMNEKLVNAWNEIVDPEDEVYYIGDFSMAFRPVELYTKRLNGSKFLIPGNHDFCHSVHKKSRSKENQDKWIAKYIENGWIVLPEEFKFDSIPALNLCHLPYGNLDHKNLENGPRYLDKRPKDDGQWLLCGHVHNSWKMKGKMINVGVDVWDYKPVSLDQILGLMREFPNGV